MIINYKKYNIFKKYKKFAFAIIASLIIIIFGAVMKFSLPRNTMTYNEFLKNINIGNIEKAYLSDNESISFYLKNNTEKFFTSNPRKDNLKEILLMNDIEVYESRGTLSILQLLFSVSFCIFIGCVVYKSFNKNRSYADIGEEAAKEQIKSFCFDNIAGSAEAKESVADIVDFIKNPEKYEKLGARIPRGIVFYGPPGTGKTLLAKGVAGEAGVPFYSVSGSDFVQMYVGVGAGRIRALFKKARENGKAVIFIDEIDSLGRKRSGYSGASEERDQTLNALLTEMCGFSSSDGIVVIAATNRIDMLDEALLRAGRFDRRIEVGLPDKAGRREIIKLHLSKKPFDEKIDIDKLSEQTVYFSGAAIETLINEAAILSAKAGNSVITAKAVQQAYYELLAGAEKKDRGHISTRDNMITAYHEAGHALLTRLLTPETIISRISIIPSSNGIGGYCHSVGRDKAYVSKKELEARIMIYYGGRAAEELIFGVEGITTGAQNDIEQATGLIKRYAGELGMNGSMLNMSVLGADEELAAQCSSIAERLYNNAGELLKENVSTLETVAAALIKNESLDRAEIDLLMAEASHKSSLMPVV